MRAFILILLPFLALFLQTTLFQAIPIQGVVPDLLLLLVVFYALFNGSSKGALYGVAWGLWEDLYLGRVIGVNAISKGITAFLVGRMQGSVYPDNVMVGVIAAITGTLINALLLLVISLVAVPGFSMDGTILMKVLFQGLYNVVVAIPLYIWYCRSSGAGILREGQSL